MLSLVIVTVLYVLVAAVAVGAWDWKKFAGSDATLAAIMNDVTGQSFWGTLLAMRRRDLHRQRRPDRPLRPDPHPLRDVPRRTRAQGLRQGRRKDRHPRTNTLIVSLLCGGLAAVVPLGELVNATSIGTLFAFALVNVAVVVLRFTRPDMERSFKVPFGPVFAVLGFLCCGYSMYSLDLITWVYFGAWMAAGLVFYFLYGMRRSRLASAPTVAETSAEK